RSELLIFLTPSIVRSHEDMAMYNQVEMDRLNWCFQDVMDLHGPIGNIYQGTFADGSGPEEVYPELRTPGIPQYDVNGSHGQPLYEPSYDVIPDSAPQPLGRNLAPTKQLPADQQPAKEEKTSGLTPSWRKNQ
ncbi:MAG: hypothetical protein Q8M16_16115, partial [Pirellulaceae bacterium]|nr:hypothetical protein [Pirellulaceae bacterium]